MIENNEKLIDMLAGGSLYSNYAKEKAEKAEKAQAVKDKKEEKKEYSQGNGEVDGDFQMTSGGGQRRSGPNKKDGSSSGTRGGKRGGRGGAQ
jgi:hypothetical protein